jgi:ribosomal protein S18 acetylase RimI-like enzyme
MKVRRASKSDAKRIAEISRVAFEKAFRSKENADEVDEYLAALDTTYFETSMASPGCQFLVISADEEVFGFAQLIKKTPPKEVGTAWLKLERLYLNPARIGTGAGKLLMQEYLNLARQDATEFAWLEVLNTNKRAVEFYERLGFVTFDTCPGKFKDPEAHDLRMKKRLNNPQ